MQTARVFGRAICLKNACSNPLVNPVRWSRYNKDYLPPTIDKEALSQPLHDEDPRKYKPIKAAYNEEMTSVNYDPLYQTFIRMGLKDGNKRLMRDIMDKTYSNIKIAQLEKYHKASTDEEKAAIDLNPREIFHKAIENCKPLLETCKVKKGGVSYQVPIPCSEKRQTFKSIKWIIETCKDKEARMRFHEKLAMELIEAAQNEGKSVRKKQEMHRLCEANKAYSQFKWVK